MSEAHPGADVGIDVASIRRVAAAVDRSPRLRDRVFTAAEQADCAGHPERWATRWAAKEAVRKLAAGGAGPLPSWRDIEVRRRADGRPSLRYLGEETAVAVSLSHEGDIAVAVASGALTPPEDRPAGRPSVAPPPGMRLPERPPDGNKGTFGTVVVVAGSHALSGAAYLSAMGAARAGAGRVRLCVPAELHSVMAVKCVEVMPHPLPDGGRGVLGRDAVSAVRELHLPHAQALVTGPGIGLDGDTEAALTELLRDLPCAVVVDADGLTLGARSGLDWRAAGRPVVLTPHPGEMSRLCGLPTAEVQADRRGVAATYARQRGATVVLKGAGTVVADPDGRVLEAPFRLPALATGGTGDVLSGVIGAMLAAGLGAFDAAVAAVWIHGEAGAALQAASGRAGTLASDLLPLLPAAQERWRRALERT